MSEQMTKARILEWRACFEKDLHLDRHIEPLRKANEEKIALCDMALHAAEPAEPVAWMRVIHSSDGHPVLFYIENDTEHDDCSMIHCYARFDGFDADMKLQGIPTEKVADAFAALETRAADAVVNSVAKMMEGDDDGR